MNRELFIAGLAPTFPERYDSAADAAAIWQSFHLHDGQENSHLLIRYIEDRRENADRWTAVLEETDVPLSFVWGMLDPVSGAHMADHIRERLPDAPFTALEDVAHWPALEAPDRVVAALLGRQP
jgi:pimeloyl-ACP methyl ester carboxylesterase